MPDAIFVGVGGQGLITLSNVFYKAALAAGFHVNVKNVKGLAQRGGAVNSKASWGTSPAAAVPDYIKGSLDYLIALEQLEGIKYLPHLKKGGTALISNRQIYPGVSLLEKEEYPGDIEKFRLQFPDITMKYIDISKISSQLPSVKSENVIMLGFFAKTAGVSREHFHGAINSVLPEKLRAENILAFDSGYDAE